MVKKLINILLILKTDIQQKLEKVFGIGRFIVVKGDICRKELIIEVEGVSDEKHKIMILTSKKLYSQLNIVRNENMNLHIGFLKFQKVYTIME